MFFKKKKQVVFVHIPDTPLVETYTFKISRKLIQAGCTASPDDYVSFEISEMEGKPSVRVLDINRQCYLGSATKPQSKEIARRMQDFDTYAQVTEVEPEFIGGLTTSAATIRIFCHGRA